jgi:hypothetical protein
MVRWRSLSAGLGRDVAVKVVADVIVAVVLAKMAAASRLSVDIALALGVAFAVAAAIVVLVRAITRRAAARRDATQSIEYAGVYWRWRGSDFLAFCTADGTELISKTLRVPPARSRWVTHAGTWPEDSYQKVAEFRCPTCRNSWVGDVEDGPDALVADAARRAHEGRYGARR